MYLEAILKVSLPVLLLDWAARPTTGPERSLRPGHDTRLLLGVVGHNTRLLLSGRCAARRDARSERNACKRLT